MTRQRGWIGGSIVSPMAVALSCLVAAGCGAPPCERPTLELVGDLTEPLRKSRRVQVKPTIRHLESHITVGCTAEWSGAGGVRVSVCALGRCVDAEGPQAYLDLWPRDWEQLPELEHVTCRVIQKERQVFEGPWWSPHLVETLPERTLLVANVPVASGCEAAPEGPRYCADGQWRNDRWVCSQWTR